VRTIFHHTAGHHRELGGSGESYIEAVGYAQAIQAAHMAKGGLGAPNGAIDSGHNFLVTRNGFIFEGRHRSIEMIQKGKMVESAHCAQAGHPESNQNVQPGIEHEQVDPESLTAIQREASVWLHAWICSHTGIRPTQIEPHRLYVQTACPGVLVKILPGFRRDVAAALTAKPAAEYTAHITNRDKTEDFVQADNAYADQLWDRFRHHGQFVGLEFTRNE